MTLLIFIKEEERICLSCRLIVLSKNGILAFVDEGFVQRQPFHFVAAFPPAIHISIRVGEKLWKTREREREKKRKGEKERDMSKEQADE